MARDMAKKNEFDNNWKKENTVQYNVRFTSSSGIPDAMQRVNGAGIPTKTYIREALVEKLRKDGYLAENSAEN